MNFFKIPSQKSVFLLTAAVVIIWGAINCTYDPLPPPQQPIFYQTLNFPLADVTILMGDLKDTTNHIYGDSLSDSLFFKFTGSLDTVTLTEDIFVIPAAPPVAFQQGFADMGEYNNPQTISVSKRVSLASQFGLDLPQDEDISLDPVPRTPLVDERTRYKIFDRDSIPYFERVEYMTVESGTFETTIENELLMDLDSVRIRLRNVDGDIIAESFYETIPAGASRSDSQDLAGAQVEDSVAVVLSATLHGTDGETLTIPAGSDPYMNIEVDVSIDNIESFTGIPEPIETPISQPLPESDNTIIRGILGETPTLSPDTNLISWQIENTLPLNMRIQIGLLNFYGDDGAITIEETLGSGESVTNSERLDLDTLRNPDQTTIVEEFSVLSFIELLPDEGDTLTTIPLDLGEGQFSLSLTISTLKFKEIVGFFNVSFEIPPMSITDIPTGFGNLNFGAVILGIHLYNEIQAQTDINFTIEGYRENVDPQSVTATESIVKATDLDTIAESILNIDIAPVFNMVPDSILVYGEASIPANDTSRLQVDRSFWGLYEIVVPFNMQMEEMTFIPVTSNRLEAMDAETRQRIRSGYIEGGIETKVTNDFPVSGSIDLLIANYDYFPIQIDSVDSVYYREGDSIFVDTDTGRFHISIDTLVSLLLPRPEVLDDYGRVKEPGYIYQRSELDSARLEIILGEEVHYIRPRIHFDSTEGFVTIGFNDQINILANLSLTVDAAGFFSPEEEDTTAADTLGRILARKKAAVNSSRELYPKDNETLEKVDPPQKCKNPGLYSP